MVSRCVVGGNLPHFKTGESINFFYKTETETAQQKINVICIKITFILESKVSDSPSFKQRKKHCYCAI